MLDLAAVEARQGDSGGPIINQRGEVCGVLFGSAPGYTIGSYGGRVRQFLATVIPNGQPGSDRTGTTAMAGVATSTPAGGPATPPANALPGGGLPGSPTSVPLAQGNLSVGGAVTVHDPSAAAAASHGPARDAA